MRFLKASVKNLLVLTVILTGCATLSENPLTGPIYQAVKSLFTQTYTFTVTAPAKYPDTVVVKSVKVEPFQALSNHGRQYAAQLGRFVEIGIAKEGFIAVVDRNPMAVISGNIEFGKLQKDAYSTSYKSDDGTQYTYYYVKKLTIAGNYSLRSQNDGRVIMGDTFNVNFEKKWSSHENAGEAKAEALTDEQIVHSVLGQVASQIVSAATPHKKVVTRELEKGGDSNIELGNTYLENGRTGQAVGIWQQVADQTAETETKAAAYYNIGVVREAQGRHKEAFELFSSANRLNPEKELYMKAMSRTEKAHHSQEIIRLYTH